VVSNTVILAESLGTVVIRDSLLPKGIVQYPDTRSAQLEVNRIIIENSVIGGPDSSANLHYHLNAKYLCVKNTEYVNIDNTALLDETIGPCIRTFDHCTFDFGELRADHDRWDGQVYFAQEQVSPKFTWNNCMILTEGAKWSFNDKFQNDWIENGS
jgi:hypothetical protein